MKVSNIKRASLVSAVLFAAAFLTMPATVSASSRNKQDKSKLSNHKVTICHRTNSATNRYRLITISYKAFDGNQNDDHTHHTGQYAHSEEFARELKKQHIKWGDVVETSKCTSSKKNVLAKEDQPKQAVLAVSKTNTPQPPVAEGKVLADTGVSAVVNSIAALAIIGAVGVTSYLSRPKRLLA